MGRRPGLQHRRARQPHIFEIFGEIEKWLADKTKYEAVDILRKFEVPCAPVLSMKEIANDPALRASGSVVEVEQKERGTYLTVGSPIKFSDVHARDHRVRRCSASTPTRSCTNWATTRTP